MKDKVGKEPQGERKGEKNIGVKGHIWTEHQQEPSLPGCLDLFLGAHETLQAIGLKFSSLSRSETTGERTQLQAFLLGQLSWRGLTALFVFMFFQYPSKSMYMLTLFNNHN